MVIAWPDNTPEIIDDIRDAIGRDITIYQTVSGIVCPEPGCDLDPVTGLSTNQFCPVCGGEYYINTVSGFVTNAHVTELNKLDTPVWTPGGLIVDGDMRVQFKLTVSSLAAVESAEYYSVDNKEYITKNISYRGIPELNRVIVALVEREG